MPTKITEFFSFIKFLFIKLKLKFIKQNFFY